MPHFRANDQTPGHRPPHSQTLVWHLGLVMQGLTAITAEEKRDMPAMIAATDGGTDPLHEGFHADDPTVYTREWFTWPCSLFAEFVERCVDEGVIGE